MDPCWRCGEHLGTEEWHVCFDCATEKGKCDCGAWNVGYNPNTGRGMCEKCHSIYDREPQSDEEDGDDCEDAGVRALLHMESPVDPFILMNKKQAQRQGTQPPILPGIRRGRKRGAKKQTKGVGMQGKRAKLIKKLLSDDKQEDSK